MKKMLRIIAAFMIAFTLMTGTSLADWTCSGCGSTASGNFCSYCGQASGGELSIFSEYEYSTENMLRATINGERITFYLDEAELDDWLGSSFTVAAAKFVAYYPDGAARCEIIISLPEDIDSYTTVTSSSYDVYKFTYYTRLNEDNKWASPAYRLWRGDMYNDTDDNHTAYGDFELTTYTCDGSYYSGTLDCTLTATTYSGGYHYDDSDTITIEDIEFDYFIGKSHPVCEELGVSRFGKYTGSTNSNTTQYQNEYCEFCYGMGFLECGVCGAFGMCGACDGFGHFTRYTYDGIEYETCGACGGTGACSNCGYSGFIDCYICGGTGYSN